MICPSCGCGPVRVEPRAYAEICQTACDHADVFVIQVHKIGCRYPLLPWSWPSKDIR